MFCYYIQQYNYRVKIINTEKRSEFVVREMRSHRRRFDSILEVKMAIKSELKTVCQVVITFKSATFLGKDPPSIGSFHQMTYRQCTNL